LGKRPAKGYCSRHFFSVSSIWSSLIETSRVKSGQRTFPIKSVETLNLFWQSLLHAHIEQYLFSVTMISSRQVFDKPSHYTNEGPGKKLPRESGAESPNVVS